MGILLSTIRLLLRAYQLVMIAAAIISWIPDLRGSDLYNFLFALVEPVTAPVRELMRRIPGIDRLPIDLSFLVVYVLISIVINII